MTELNKFSNEINYKEDENFNRLLSLFHTGTEVKRELLDCYLSEKKLDLLDWLTSLSIKFLQFEDVKRALRKSETIQLTDLDLNTIDIVLKYNCFDMFWDCCLLNTSFEDILNSHRDMLYSRYENLDNQHDNRNLTKDQLDILFKRVEDSVTDEVGNEQCTSISKRIIAGLESKLNFFILSVICPLFKSVNAVSECQGKISKIAVLKSQVVDLQFTDLWDKMEAHIDNISSFCKLSEYFKRQYTKIKKAKCNRTLAQQNRKYILEEAFNNPDFVVDKVFCNLVRKELDLMTNEENLNLAKILSGGNIHVQLTDGKCRNSAYSLSVIDSAENNLEFLHSLCSSPDNEKYQEEVDDKTQIDDNQNRLLKCNHLKLVQLITEIARDVLADVLKDRIPSGSFGVFFNGMKTQILSLLDNHGCQLLYPDNSNYKGDLSDMDITLLYIILRNLNTIGPHTKEWGNTPNDDDRCLSANIDRIRIAKNRFVSHRSKHLLNAEEFWKVWKDIRQCIIEIATELTSCTEYSDRIDYLLASEIDPMTEMQHCNAYKRETKGQIRLERKIICIQEGINDIKRHLNITNQQPMDNAPNRKDSYGNIPIELRIDGENVPSVEEIQEGLKTLTTHEMHINFVKKGSIIIGLDVQHSAFHDVGHFFEMIDTLLSGLLQRHTKNKNEHSSYVIVSLDFLDRNNEPLTFHKPQVQFMEDKGYYLENDEATELDEKLNEVSIHVCTTEEIHEHLENMITEMFHQRQHAYLQRSPSNIPSKVLQMKGQATDTTFNLDKSSVKFQPDNEDEEKEEMETSIKDSFICGQCKNTYTSIHSFKKHKMTHMPRERQVLVMTITVEGLPDDLAKKCIELHIPKEIHVNDLKVVDEAFGSLIILTKMSTGAFKAKDVIFADIEKILNEIFSKSPEDIQRAVDVTIDVVIEDDDYENDEDNSFRCGVCYKEFSVLEAFQRHKLSFCSKNYRQQTAIPVSDRCEIVEYNMDAFPRLQDLQHNLSSCIEMDVFQNKIISLLGQYPCALFYSGSFKHDMDLFYQRNHRKNERMILSLGLITALEPRMPNVYLCVLRGEDGHLMSTDTKCLEKMKTGLSDQWIDKTLFVVTATSFSGSLRNFHTLSQEIGTVLGLRMHYITHRIFKDKDEDIYERMSFYFAKKLVEKQDSVRRHLNSFCFVVQSTKNNAESSTLTEKVRQHLSAGPLGDSLHRILRDSSRSYIWRGESFTRNKLTIRTAADQIARFACEELGKQIADTIIDKSTREWLYYNPDFASTFLRNIILTDIPPIYWRNILIRLLNMFLGFDGWIIGGIILLISKTDINSLSFRDKIACKMETQINRNKDKIIREVVDKLRFDIIQRCETIKASLSNSERKLCQMFYDQERLIIKESIEHEFRTIARKNELIRNFKFEDDTLKIYACGNQEDYADVKEFVDTYFRPDVNTQVIMDQNTEEI